MKYRLLAAAYINDKMWEEGTEIGDGTQVPFSGIPGPHMEPIDKDAEKAMKAYLDAHPGVTLDPYQAGGAWVNGAT